MERDRGVRDTAFREIDERTFLENFSEFLHEKSDIVNNPDDYDRDTRLHNFGLIVKVLDMATLRGLDPLDMYRKAEEKYIKDHPHAGENKGALG